MWGGKCGARAFSVLGGPDIPHSWCCGRFGVLGFDSGSSAN